MGERDGRRCEARAAGPGCRPRPGAVLGPPGTAPVPGLEVVLVGG